MDLGFGIVLLVSFLAVVFLIEGAYLLWNAYKSPEVKRIERRLRALSAGRHGSVAESLLKRRSIDEANWLERALLQIPRVSTFDRTLEQAGSQMSVLQFTLVTGISALAAAIIAFVLAAPWFVVVLIGAGAGVLPLLIILHKRSRRMLKIGEQLPDAVDLIARALRAGHAFSAALQMVGEEAPEPIAAEFRITAEELNYGVAAHDAFMNLATRVPTDDLRYFAIAVLLQRETGGNLAEILGNISKLIRERMQLLGKIRVLSAEGRLSAYILIGLPFATAAMINIVNPKFMSVLWTDPGGLRLVWTTVTLMVIGVFWMWRIVKIRV
jgi:tight adherence protein B